MVSIRDCQRCPMTTVDRVFHYLQRPALVAFVRHVLSRRLKPVDVADLRAAPSTENALGSRADVAMIRIERGLANICAVVQALPLDVYRLTLRAEEIEIYDRRRRAFHLAWPGDWLVRSPDGTWQVFECDGFGAQHESLPPTAPDSGPGVVGAVAGLPEE